MNKINYIKIAKRTSSVQISELKKVNKIFNKTFIKAIDLISNCKGKIIAAGVGKSGLIARKIMSKGRWKMGNGFLHKLPQNILNGFV